MMRDAPLVWTKIILIAIGLFTATQLLDECTASLGQKTNGSQIPTAQFDSSSANITGKQQDQFEGWKSYSNSAMGFSVQYPSDWMVIDVSERDVLFHSPDLSYDGAVLARGAEIWIHHVINPENLSLEEFVQEEQSRLLPNQSTSSRIVVGANYPALELKWDEITSIYLQRGDGKFLKIDLAQASSSDTDIHERAFYGTVDTLRLNADATR